MTYKTEKISREKIERLVKLYREGLIYFIARYVKDLDEAEDLAEDVFVEIIMHPDRFRRASSEKTYLYAIGRNLAIDFLRKNHRMNYVDPAVLYSEEHGETGDGGSFEGVTEPHRGNYGFGSGDRGLSPEESLLAKEDKQKLRAALMKIKPEYSEAIRLVYFEEMSYEEAAQVMKKSGKQIENLVYRAKKSLRDLLESDEIISK